MSPLNHHSERDVKRKAEEAGGTGGAGEAEGK
jgi:hypothetical protein